MDFSKLDTKADAEKGSWLHFVHPQTGHKLYSGPGADDYGRKRADRARDEAATPVRALVCGVESDTFQDYLKRGADEDENFATAKALVKALEGVRDEDGKEVKATAAGLDWFFGKSGNFAVQVLNHARDAKNFATFA